VDGQYVAYTFFRVDPSWRRLPVEERAAGKDAFAEVVEEWSTRMESLRAFRALVYCEAFVVARYAYGVSSQPASGVPLSAVPRSPRSW